MKKSKKNIVVLSISLSVVAFLSWYTYGLVNNSNKSDKNLIEFSIADTASIDKIIITDVHGESITLKRNKDKWADQNNSCINQPSVQFIIETIKNIEFKSYLPDASLPNFKKKMLAQHIKVEIFTNGKWNRNWYIGPATQDHYGQIMLLETEEGKSKDPIITSVKGEHGIIDPRFFADKRKWLCTEIFSLNSDEIKSVAVVFTNDLEKSFKVVNSKIPAVYQNNKEIPSEPVAVLRYLQNYTKIHFNLANYELNKNQIDSLKKTTPFVTLKLTEKKGKKTTLKLFKMVSANQQAENDSESIEMDADKFWCELDNGQLVKCQYFVFNPLIIGNPYFPSIKGYSENENNPQ